MWTTDTNGQCFAGNVNDTYPITANTTVYAKWVVIEYTIIYDGNGATSGNTVDYPVGRLHSVETNWQLVNNGFARTGYHFVGWNTKPDRSGMHFDNLAFASYTYIDAEKDGVVTLYAEWDPNTYDIVFNMNPPDYANSTGYTGIKSKSGSMEDITDCRYDADVTLTSNKYVIPGWKFKGWATEATGNDVYLDGKTYKNLGAHGKDGEKVNLYAVWEVDPYTIGQYVGNAAPVSDSAKGGKKYRVYNDITLTPQSTEAGYIHIIDWSSCTGTVDYINAVKQSDGTRYGGGNFNHYIAYVDEVYFIGNPDAVYTNMHIYMPVFLASASIFRFSLSVVLTVIFTFLFRNCLAPF